MLFQNIIKNNYKKYNFIRNNKTNMLFQIIIKK